MAQTELGGKGETESKMLELENISEVMYLKLSKCF